MISMKSYVLSSTCFIIIFIFQSPLQLSAVLALSFFDCRLLKTLTSFVFVICVWHRVTMVKCMQGHIHWTRVLSSQWPSSVLRVKCIRSLPRNLKRNFRSWSVSNMKTLSESLASAPCEIEVGSFILCLWIPILFTAYQKWSHGGLRVVYTTTISRQLLN